MATPSPANSDGAGESAAMLDAWRARGDHRFDPVRFRFIEALARRSARHDGEARRILDARLAALLAAYGEDLEQARRAAGEAGSAKQEAPRGALAALVDHIARHAPAQGDDPSTADGVPGRPAVPELKTLRYFKSTWTRLSADRRLAQSQALVPKKAGPLNSQQLVHRTLTLMRELSPGYLERFMAYVDALSWLEQTQAGSAPAATSAPRAESPRKSARGKSR